MCDIFEGRHDSMSRRNGFIGLFHIHVQSNFIGRSLGCNHDWGYSAGRLFDFLDYVITYKFLQLRLQFWPYVERDPSVTLSYWCYCMVNM